MLTTIRKTRIYTALSIIIAAAVLALLGAVLFSGCGPSPAHCNYNPHFLFVVHNNDVAYPTTATCTWWRGSQISGKHESLIPGGGFCAFDLGDQPDGVEVNTIVWPAPFGAVWQSPDYKAWRVFHINYPSGTSWGEVPASGSLGQGQGR